MTLNTEPTNSYEASAPKVVPMTKAEFAQSIGRRTLSAIVKVSHPSPSELTEMLELAQELPKH